MAGRMPRGATLSRVELTSENVPATVLSSWSNVIAEKFPTIDIAVVAEPDAGAWCVDLAEWCRPSLSFWQFDGRADEAMEVGMTVIALQVRPPANFRNALEVLTRCQRWMGRRNGHTQGPAFDAVLDAHRSLYDLEKPLLLADYRHALDTWQWVLRLNGNASPPLQVAALFHDIERIVSEADVRVEHLAPDYEGFKRSHARRGADMTRHALRNAPIDAGDMERIVALVARHEKPSDDEDLALLNDADALSFFSLNSAGFFDYYDAAHAARKVRYTIGRMRATALAELATVRLRGDVAAATRQSIAAAVASPALLAP
jgi:Domain of unknown function (DUF4202)